MGNVLNLINNIYERKKKNLTADVVFNHEKLGASEGVGDLNRFLSVETILYDIVMIDAQHCICQNSKCFTIQRLNFNVCTFLKNIYEVGKSYRMQNVTKKNLTTKIMHEITLLRDLEGKVLI